MMDKIIMSLAFVKINIKQIKIYIFYYNFIFIFITFSDFFF